MSRVALIKTIKATRDVDKNLNEKLQLKFLIPIRYTCNIIKNIGHTSRFIVN
jgi:hypothetical protein